MNRKSARMRVGEAIDRFELEETKYCDGRRSLKNLAREADVHVSSVKRFPDLVARFRELPRRELEGTVPTSTPSTDKSERASKEVRDLRFEIEILAHQVQSLSLENEAMREELARQKPNVVPLKPVSSTKKIDTAD